MSTTETKQQYKVIGKRPVRHDGVDKVTGRAVYGADVQLPGMLYGKVLRSPHAHARIKSIRTDKALALEGVKAVVTAADLPDSAGRSANLGELGEVPLQYISHNVLASGKVLYQGHAIAAVAATSSHLAEEALDLIEVEYEVLPPVLEVLQAMQENAPLLHSDLFTMELGQKSNRPSNIASHQTFHRGDVKAGFAAADLILEREYRSATVHQGYIEPHAATAVWNADGHVTLWCTTQGAFSMRTCVHQVLGIPVSKLKVIPTEIGGGFGGKIPAYGEPVAALLARKARRPVKVVMDRTEVFLGTGPTSGSYVKLKMGVKRDGRIVAAEAMLAYEGGGFPGAIVGAGGLCLLAPYKIENFVIDMYDVVVNKPKTAAYRAPGAPNSEHATEAMIDEFCDLLKMDPLEFRLKNAAEEGDAQANDVRYPRIGFIETLEAARSSEHYRSKLTGPNHGRGVAAGYWMNAGLTSSVVARLNSDGTVTLAEGSTDIGGTRTSVAMQLAESFGIRAEDVNPSVVDTDSVGYTEVTGGSRVTFATGYAAYEAGQALRSQVVEQAAKLWKVEPERVLFEDGLFRDREDAAKEVSLPELAEILAHRGVDIRACITVTPQKVGGAFGVHIADVEVDPETGKVTILRYTAVQDVGKAIHPSYVEGQMQGGVAQGIGWALNEEYVYNNEGKMLNASFLDYRMPTSLDLPMIETIIVEVPNPGHPYGVRGVGEVPIVPPLATIANAIAHATGVRLYELPMSPPRVVKAMQAKK
ncbi:MAG: xanthine dehydrogenase family protein molybdopterin-binding subunit [Acidobacteria bacterium]|nr:xanthine dehydrogenase family protein molybdopterin-binding subunit [Acidobacteriota bacterium]